MKEIRPGGARIIVEWGNDDHAIILTPRNWTRVKEAARLSAVQEVAQRKASNGNTGTLPVVSMASLTSTTGATAGMGSMAS
jgi:hypothetical protein